MRNWAILPPRWPRGRRLGKVSAETLQHLLGRLNELQNEFDQAILADSEFRLRRSQAKFASVWHWVEKGTEIIRAITADGDLTSLPIALPNPSVKRKAACCA